MSMAWLPFDKISGGLKPGSPGPMSEGFTLLELLISIFLLILVILITMGAMRIGHRAVTWGDRKTDFQERFRAAIPAIEAQIQSALPTGLIGESKGTTDDSSSAEPLSFQGDRNGMRFSTNYSVWDGRRGYLQVAYRIVQDADGRKNLYISETTLGMAAQRDALLLASMDEISFDYFSADALESGSWIPEWKKRLAVPEKIWIHLQHRGKDFSMVVPMRVKRNLVRNIAVPVDRSNSGGAASAK